MTADPFEVAGIRHRVLAAWAASPVRFREDANAEEDLVGGGYRDRLVVELAQNAADAAARAGRPGELLLRLAAGAPGDGGDGGSVLVAANTGAPLDAAGVSALATLRASAKRDGQAVGRFGVGFAAVLAVTDEPAVISRGGGVRFSAADTRELVRAAGSGELTEELGRRDGHVPVLRLPFAAEAAVPEGYDTVVVLPLRDAAAADVARRLLDQVDDGLLLALPGLARIRVEIDGEPDRALDDVGSRWSILRRDGEFAPDLVATLPTEERLRTRWQVTWALPSGEVHQVPAVVHAPTPCEEPLPWPAVLVATLPLEPSRRHVAPGPVTDAVIRQAARAYVDLLAERAARGVQAWPLVVTGLPAGAVDGALRAEVDRLLPSAPVLVAAEDGAPVRPRDAVTLAGSAGSDDAVLAALAPRLAGLVAAPRAARAVFRRLGVPELELADVIEALPEDPPGQQDPRRWHSLYSALAPIAIDPLVREALARMPVPLAGSSRSGGPRSGTTARGVRGLVLPGLADDAVAEALARLGARVVHPQAVHPLLERLGASVAGPRALVELDVVRAAVQASRDEEDEGEGDEVRDAVLTLVDAAVRAGELAPGDLPWLADLALPDEDGEPAPAGALALPGSPAADWFDPEEIGLLDAAVLRALGPAALTAAGVLVGPALLRAADVPLEGLDSPGPLDEPGSPADLLDGWDDWCEYALDQLDDGRPAAVPELLAVRDLDAVSGDALPDVVAAIAADPVLRPALTGRCRVVGGGPAVDVLPYTAWWLRERLARFGAAAPGSAGGGAVAAAGARDGLAGLLPPAAGWLGSLDPSAQSALGVIGSLDDVDAAAASAVFDCLVDPSRDVAAWVLLGLLRRFASLAGAGLRWPAPPSVVRGLDLASGTTVVVDADDAAVLESPMYLQRRDLGVVLPVPAPSAGFLAELFDLPLAADLVPGVVAGAGGAVQPTPAVAAHLLPSAPSTWCEHDELMVDGVLVDWWVAPSGVVHAATVAGLARGLCWSAGGWPMRAVVEQVLTDPSLAADAVLDATF